MLFTLIVTAIGLLLTFSILFALLFRRPSVESELVEKVTRPVGMTGGDAAVVIRDPEASMIDVDSVAKPFSLIRGIFSGAPDANLSRRLALAGFRKPAHADIFLGSRLIVPPILALLVAYFVGDNGIFYFLITIVVAFFIPDFWLTWAINKRRDSVRLALPDALDLLSICMEAGLSLDQSVLRVGKELRVAHKALAEELLQVNMEQRVGVPRLAAWKSMADRLDIESVRSFVAMLVQTDRFGTPLSKSLGAFSDALRIQRRQKAEEAAAKTTIKLVLPLVLFILPEVFIVTVAPAVITVMKNMGALGGNT